MHLRLRGCCVHVSIAALAITESVFFLLAMFVAVALRFAADADAMESIGPVWPRAVVFDAACLLSFTSFGLYSARQRARMVGLSLRVVTAVMLGTAAVIVGCYLFPNLWAGRGVFAIAAAFAIFSAYATRIVLTRVVDSTLLKRRVLVYGAGKRATAVANLRRRTDRRGHVLIGFVRPDGEEVAVPPEAVHACDGGLPDLCRRLKIDELVIAMDDRRRQFPLGPLLECRLAGLEITDVVSFLERETGVVRVDLLNPAWMIFGGGFKRDLMRRLSSRVLDVAASLLILVVSSPLILLTMAAIKIEGGPNCALFYRQRRIGYGGQMFNLLKFRSMRADAEAQGLAIWAQPNDPRTTRVGAMIRKLRIDELPQIFNVLCGHMSLVGPRPERPQFVDDLARKIPYYAQRHSVKPGITGWAQVCYPYGSSEHDALQKLQYDLYYIKNSSLLFDIAIILQTAEVVFWGKGAR
ncbi:MAG: TIGR03013 family XrtA/PEP-CTERM system glycosyltransferase [Gammaproteobacteria bacterium]